MRLAALLPVDEDHHVADREANLLRKRTRRRVRWVRGTHASKPRAEGALRTSRGATVSITDAPLVTRSSTICARVPSRR